MKAQTDEHLVRAVQEGDILAFEELVKRYQRPLYAFIFRLIRDPHMVEEIVQDTLFSAYQAIGRIDPTKKFSSYVFTIAKNATISRLRSTKHHVSLDEITELSEEAPLYENLFQQERKTSVQNAIKSLEQKYRRIISLYYFDDLSYEEIGKRLRLPLNTVRTHLMRAKKQLKKILTYETY